VRRFRDVEAALERAGRSVREASLEELEALWQEAKRR
jgi:ATP diphosphatase